MFETDAPENLRRVAALHRELSRLCPGKTYFLSCRDTAKAYPGLSRQSAYNINLALAQLGVIEIVRVGDARPNGKASQFRYLLSDNGEAQIAAWTISRARETRSYKRVIERSKALIKSSTSRRHCAILERSCHPPGKTCLSGLEIFGNTYLAVST